MITLPRSRVTNVYLSSVRRKSNTPHDTPRIVDLSEIRPGVFFAVASLTGLSLELPFWVVGVCGGFALTHVDAAGNWSRGRRWE